jgi:hypothetical protein
MFICGILKRSWGRDTRNLTMKIKEYGGNNDRGIIRLATGRLYVETGK